MPSRQPASCLTCCCRRMPGLGPAQMPQGPGQGSLEAHWDLDLAPMEPQPRTPVRRKTLTRLKSTLHWIGGWSDWHRALPGLQAAATAANTLPAMIHQTHHAKPARARKHRQSTNTALTLGWRTRCGAWSSTRLNASWWRTRSTPGTNTQHCFALFIPLVMNKKRSVLSKHLLANASDLLWLHWLKSGQKSNMLQNFNPHRAVQNYFHSFLSN